MERNGFINEFSISGRMISKTNLKSGDTRIVVMTKNGDRDVYAHILCPKDVMIRCDMRAHICVKGYIMARTFPARNGGGLQYNQTMVAESIELSKTLTEDRFGVKSRFYPLPSCKIYLKGTVHSVFDNDGLIRYQVTVGSNPEGEQTSTIRLSMKKLDRHPEARPGDTICIISGLSTPVKTINGRKTHFSDLIISDLAVLPSLSMLND